MNPDNTHISTDISLYTCHGCKVKYQSNRALSIHLRSSLYCNDFMQSHPLTLTPLQNYNEKTINNIEEAHFATTFDYNHNHNEPESNLEHGFNNDDSLSTEKSNQGSENEFYHSTEIIHEIKLLKILTNIGAPLYAYQTIMKWAQEAYLSDYKFDTTRKTYQQTIKYLEEDLQFHVSQPKFVPVTLFKDN